jgi:hypothetical protein
MFCKKNKNNVIAILIDSTFGLTKLTNKIQSYKNLKSVPSWFNKRNIKYAEVGDVLVLSSANSDYHYGIYEVNEVANLKVDKLYILSEDLYTIFKYIDNFVVKNNLVEKKSPSVTITDLTITTVTTEVIPVTPVKKNNSFCISLPNVLPIDIHSNFVKVGYDIYEIKKDIYTNDKFFVRNGVKYYVEEDIFGNKTIL